MLRSSIRMAKSFTAIPCGKALGTLDYDSNLRNVTLAIPHPSCDGTFFLLVIPETLCPLCPVRPAVCLQPTSYPISSLQAFSRFPGTSHAKPWLLPLSSQKDLQ